MSFSNGELGLGEDFPQDGVDYDESYLEKLKDVDRRRYNKLSKRFADLKKDVLGFHLPFIGVGGKVGQKKYKFEVLPIVKTKISVF